MNVVTVVEIYLPLRRVIQMDEVNFYQGRPFRFCLHWGYCYQSEASALILVKFLVVMVLDVVADEIHQINF